MIKALSFHGWGTDKDLNFLQLKSIRKNFPNLDITYLNGPFSFDKNLVQDQKVKELLKTDLAYSWIPVPFDVKTFHQGVEQTLQYIKDFIEKNGPYDALIGFSQGSMILMKVLEEIQNSKIRTKIPNFVLIAGSVQDWDYFIKSEKFELRKRYLKCKSIHFIGEIDVHKEYAQQNTEKFIDSLIIYHPEGHKFPKITKEMKQQIKQYLELKPQPKL